MGESGGKPGAGPIEGVLNAVEQAAADIGGAVLHAVGLTTDGAEVLADEAEQAMVAEDGAPAGSVAVPDDVLGPKPL